MTLEEALELVARVVGQRLDWSSLESFLPEGLEPQLRRSAIASSFLAALELAKQGRLQLAQEAAFAPLMVKAA
jgi:segregation and condensation protein A